MDNKIDTSKSSVYQKMIKKNKRQKNKKRLKEIELFIITNIIVPIIVSAGAALIIMVFARL